MFAQMARATLDLLLLRRGPQDLPAQKNLLYSAILVYTLFTALAYLSVAEMNVFVGALQAASGLAYLAGFTWMVLAFSGKRARFLQTFLALVLTATVFNILEVGPLISLMPHFLQMQELLVQAQGDGTALDPASVEAVNIPGFPLALLLLEYVWRLTVMAHIFHHALEISRARAAAVALLYPGLILLLALMAR